MSNNKQKLNQLNRGLLVENHMMEKKKKYQGKGTTRRLDI